MKKALRNTAVWLICAVMILGILPAITANASTGGHCQAEAVAWVKSLIGQSIDYDGVSGAQCVDLTKYYFDYLGQAAPTGNANQYSDSETADYTPPGWIYIIDDTPQPGDIAVWTGGRNGHVAIVTDVYSSSYDVVEQNYNNQGYCTSRTIDFSSSDNDVWGYIRPDFAPIVDSGNYGTNLTWTLDEEGYLYISGTGDMRDTDQFGTSTIPWYEYRESLKSVVIESGVTSVGAYAFYNCTAIQSVKIPESVQSIGKASFCRCSALTSVTLPDSLTSIGQESFLECSSLTSVVIPSGVTSLDYRVFMGCSALTSITIPGSVTSLGYEVFGGCSSLTNITIPDSVTYLEWGAFSECSSLTSVTIPESVTSIGTRAFEKCSSLTSITIPESVTDIGYSVFDRCSALTSITIPSGITTINYGMFSGCGALTSITIPASVTSIGMNAFYKCDALREVNYGGSSAQKAEIDIKEGNDCLIGAQWHCQSTGYETTVTYKGYSTQFGPNELSISSFAGINNKNMAMLCAMLSDASYSDNGVDLANLFRQMFAGTGFDEAGDTKFDYSGGAFCSGMALGKTVINDQETNVLVIVVRGTQELLSGEVIADLSGNTSDLDGYETYTELISFYTELMSRLNELTSSHSDIDEKPLKIIVTGHSLGGAGANLLTAMFNKNVYGNSWWAPVADLSDIYGYTYGAIDVMNIYKNPGHGFPLHSGYQNIHNVINDYDVIIVLSNKLRSHGLSGVGKYGHLDFFRKDYSDNHKMLNYLNAVATANVGEMKYSYNRIRISCPVDIDVYQNGKLVGRVVNNSVDESVTTIDLVVIGDDKYIFCPEGAELSFQIKATDSGQMEYSVELLSSESYEQKTFSNISLTQGERFESDVGGNTIPSDVRLYVINSEGDPVREVMTDGTEVEYQTYLVTFDANGGTGEPENQTKIQDKTLTLSSDTPDREDSADKYTVTLDPNGGKCDTETLDAQVTVSYSFKIWNTAADGTGTNYRPGADYKSNADLTLYAQWEEETTIASVTLPTPTRDGYTFKGWGTSADATSGVTGSYTPESDVTLYAVWEQNEQNIYAVTYDANGGTGAPEAQTKTQDQALTLSETVPTKDDAAAGSYTVTLDANSGNVSPASLNAERTTKYTFTNWNTATDGSGTSYSSGGSYTANAAMTLYAQWTESITTAAVTLPTPTRDGYTFKGWGTSADATSGVTGSYTPENDVTLYAVWEQNETPPQNQFTDVTDPGSYFYEAVYWAAEKGITQGTSPTTFSPGAPCTRAQIVTFLWRAMGKPAPTTTANPFRDVKSSDWFYEPVMWAVEKGITQGTSKTTFSPGNTCTRAQIVTFLWRAKGCPEPGAAANPFKDVKTSDWFYKPVMWAVQNGITTGTSKTTFSPGGTCIRAQGVTFLYRAMR